MSLATSDIWSLLRPTLAPKYSGARKSRGSKSGGSDLEFWTNFGRDPQIGPKSSQTEGLNT